MYTMKFDATAKKRCGEQNLNNKGGRQYKGSS